MCIFCIGYQRHKYCSFLFSSATNQHAFRLFSTPTPLRCSQVSHKYLLFNSIQFYWIGSSVGKRRWIGALKHYWCKIRFNQRKETFLFFPFAKSLKSGWLRGNRKQEQIMAAIYHHARCKLEFFAHSGSEDCVKHYLSLLLIASRSWIAPHQFLSGSLLLLLLFCIHLEYFKSGFCCSKSYT